ncbi:hypothetical protein DAA51_10945 [Bradyrhizobium sp. WBAH10]|nr:hypothetical protein [Bradyrhizobium sp. WBAH30]MDD1541855.1 hypothetical protein [Bradyrhizobium sp. WBAH41]MDD1555279.1 hypothetical protein [Bradyrhizobium sp. WBAH23]MDD1564110.1 hypothetical protein [Bradyrhizobium sp. WBAH33]MDD1587704.1 hypothetical protein [Bradyrhizobium sp. WBAH42]NRB87324.1 hypothetical protein [Bradyrhizobium sp. WBAH10]QCJ88972.1 hypothetical protein DAA57_11035 [Bradyrhizobium yuanmingense]
MRRSNPDCRRGDILDCFAALAMTELALDRLCPISAEKCRCTLKNTWSVRRRCSRTGGRRRTAGPGPRRRTRCRA